MNRALPFAVLVLLTACPAEERSKATGFRAVSFPSSFAWGTATAQWQIEGDLGVNGPVDSNWSRWMAMGKGVAGQHNDDGNGFFTDYAADVARAKALGLDSFRFSIDWARIEPEPGVFDEDELDHADAVVQAIVDGGMKPVLTLYHWVVPLWVQNPDPSVPGGVVDRIGVKDDAVAADFEEFVRHVVERVGDRVDTYTVLNEPLTMVSAGYIAGSFPPGRVLDIDGSVAFGINMLRMQARAYDAIKELDPDALVGMTMTAGLVTPEDPDNEQEQLSAESINYVYNDWMMIALTTGKLDVDLNGAVDDGLETDPPEGVYEDIKGRADFIGVQYYGPVKAKEVGFLSNVAPLYGLPLLSVLDYSTEQGKRLPHSGNGREISAAGFADALDHYAQWGLPMLLTENGTTTNQLPLDDDDNDATLPTLAYDDVQAPMYVVTHLWEVGRAIDRGTNILGYFHWTLADNFEWNEGITQRFGAYRVDFDDDARPRTLTPMGEALKEVADKGGIDEDLWNTWVRDRFPSDDTDDGVGPTTREPVVGTL